MAPWIDCRPGRPSLIWGLNRLTLPGPTPCAEPTATPANENTKAFQISLGWPGQQVTHYKHFLPVFPGVQEPLSLLSLPLDARNRQISFRSRLLAAAGLGLLEAIQSAHSTPGRPGLRSLSRPGSSPLKNGNPRLSTGGNVGPPERQNILQIPFPEEGVESLVRFGRKAMKKRKELFETYLVSYFSLPLITKKFKKIKSPPQK